MDYRTLGTSDLWVSELCLGTMTWGTQTSGEEAHRQIEIALEAGVNFLDTAELYPTNPARPETVGRTEEIIGAWFAATGRRDEVVLATKIGGVGQVPRGGEPITARTLRAGIEASLRRLRTGVIDLYQLHVPNRGSWSFRRNWTYDPSRQDTAAVHANMAEVAGVLAAEVKAGRIRAWGLSNETAWGLMAWNRACAAAGAPRAATVQNEYSLLCRLPDLDLAEALHHERAHLLAYSPLAMGLLTGKYLDGTVPPGSRMAVNPGLGGRRVPAMWPAAAAYAGLARRHGLDPAQMALAFVLGRPFTGAAILGATTEAQLKVALGAAELKLPAEVLAGIDAIHRAHGMPF